MKWRGFFFVVTLAAVIPLGAPPADAASPTVRFSSGRTYAAAKRVCLSASVPANCPRGAFIYDFPGAASEWRADLSSIPDANWIWRADTHRKGISDLATFRA